MTKISKIIKCLMLSGLLLSANSQKAEAFLFPPMPWDMVLDIPNDAGKYIGEGLKIKHTLSSGFTFDNALGLTGLKGGALGDEWKKLKSVQSPEMDQEGNLKTPGKGEIVASSTLNIDAQSVDEEAYFNAYHTLFFTHDFSAESVDGASPALLETAYKNKAEEYQQDMAIDTYLSAKMMEDYLVDVDKTLNRLQKCQSGDAPENECEFFGMKMAKVTDNSDDESDGDPNNKAQLAATRNAYIVTMVYDRLLRIIEDLTATEAIFQAARQMGVAKPISADKQQSSADKYINYRFAYDDSQEYVVAKGTPAIKFNNRANECEGNSDQTKCPQVNKDKTKVKSIESMDALKVLQPLEDNINKAVSIHNIKSTLPQLKSQYRQYLLQVEIHKKAQKLVKASEQCVTNFLGRHTAGNAAEIWYGGTEPTDSERFEYISRKGIAGELIKEYDDKSTNIALGTSNECDGFYETNACPAGYSWNNKKCCEANSKMCACEVKIITEDSSAEDEINDIDNNYIDGANVAKINTKYKNMADTDGFMNGNNADEVIQDSRKSAELTWYLGRDKLLETMSKYNLEFKPWNDQKMLQAEYLRNKYRNTGLIIHSTDQAVVSYKIAEKTTQDYSSEDIAAKYITAAALCDSIETAKTKARSKYCTSGYVECSVTDSEGMIITKRKKNETRYDSDGNPYIVTVSVPDIVENQKVSLGHTCVYTKGTSALNPDEICLTPDCLVKNYLKKAWGNSDSFYNAAKGKGRIVAVNKLQAVIDERKVQELKVKNLIAEHQARIKATEDAVKSAIAALTSTNEAIDKARKNKNVAANELSKTNQRLKMIETERNTLQNRKDYGLDEDIKAKKEKLAELEIEKNCLEKGQNSITSDKCDVYLTAFTVDGEMLNENKTAKYIAKPEAESMQKRYDSQYEEKSAQLETLKERVKTLQDKLAEQKEAFAERYLEAEKEAQTAIEEKNEEYEDFMVTASGESQHYQMRNSKKKECYKHGPLGLCKKEGPRRIEKNNLESTFTKIISSGSLYKIMVEELNRVFFSGGSSTVVSLLTKAGVPQSFYLDGTFSAIGLSAGPSSVQALAEKLKDAVVEVAAKELERQIKAADMKVGQAVKTAVKKVDTFMESHNINGSGNQVPLQSYLERPSAEHQDLLAELRSISESLIDGESVFGIPEDTEFAAMSKSKEGENITDNAFFAGLPARGNNYRGKNTDDTNAGRDYIAPKDMLSSLPPLREVFYFSAADYETLPQEKGRPVLTELLNCKYFATDGTCEIEYLPEVWLHLLARPNLRQDKKYQQTFVERSFNEAKLNDLVKNRLANSGIFGAKDSDYRAIIARSGVYPCRTGGKIVDMGGGDKVTDMRFKTRSSLPAGLSSVPDCQEVEFKGAKVYHLLADHGKGKNIKDTETPEKTAEPMYEKYSELGQVLTEKMTYRPLQKNIQEYLNDTKNTDNNITRQKAELASFKRNAMGGFLDAVTAEHNARKNMDSGKETIVASMKTLCGQLRELDINIDDCENKALAQSYKDSIYYERENNNPYSGINCGKPNNSFYESVFCLLDSKKDEYVGKAQKELKTVENEQGKISSSEAKKYVEERLEKIKKYIEPNKGTLIVDGNEVSTIQPDVDQVTINNTLKTAKANRQVMLDSAEEGLQAMENQSQAVAYCPVY